MDVQTEIWQCLVRDVIKKRIKDRDAAHEFLRMWEAKHDGSKLRDEVANQWKLGNRGENGDWR
jgi:hypothetical protein